MENMAVRMRRLRRNEGIRSMVRETALLPENLILPLFVSEEENVSIPLAAIPGARLLSGGRLEEEVRQVSNLGIRAVLLFGVPPESSRDDLAAAAHARNGAIQRAVRTIRAASPGMVVITDLCLCEYTSHRHCGLVKDGMIDNDLTLECMGKVALSHAEAGADIIAPSGMMDGAVRAIRKALDDGGFHQVMTMPYSAKFASRLYGPFKNATNSAPDRGLHATHQLDVADGRQALACIRRDVRDGADMVIIKPGLTSLDIIALARKEFELPIAAYDVSGTYALFYSGAGDDAAARNAVMMELLTCMRRAGADLIITYYAKEAARNLLRPLP